MPNTYTFIASTVTTTTTGAVTLSAIPSTYTDLVLKMSLRNSAAFDWGTLLLEFNGNTSNLYSNIRLRGNGTAASSFVGSNLISADNVIPIMNSNGTTSNTFSAIELYIPSYTASTNKPYSALGAAVTNATLSYLDNSSYLFRSTSAISSIKITPETGFLANSSFFLYGIKNS